MLEMAKGLEYFFNQQILMDDEIIEQGSVYISDELSQHLRLFQFPAHSKTQPSAVKYKSEAKMTKFEFELKPLKLVKFLKAASPF